MNKKKGIPYISAKIAISKDYFTINQKKKWITNDTSRKIVHLIRYKHNCIISTSKSINSDNSLLNARINGFNKNKPDLFIVDLNLKLKKKLLLNNLLKKRKTYLITSRENIKKVNIYKKLGYRIILIKSLKKKADFKLLFKKIYNLGYSRILIETGLTFLNSLLHHKIVNDIYIFKSNKKLGKTGKNNNTIKYIKKVNPKLLTINLNNDKVYIKEFK